MRVTVVLATALLAASAFAGSDLDAVKARGTLRCGVSEGIAGFSQRDASGRWTGFNVDFCRAVAAAVLGDPAKVQFTALKASNRFPALQSKTIDLLMRNTTWTLTREVLLKMEFPAVLFYDGQGFLVPKSAGVNTLDDLDGATVCVEKGTTHEPRLPDYFRMRGRSVTPLVIDSATEVAKAFFAGRCKAYTSDVAQLAAARARAPGGPEAFVILPERISKEPLGPVVRAGDVEWVSLVRWVAHVLVAAEEHGVTRGNLDAMVRQMQGSAGGRVFSGKDVRVARALGVPADWAARVIRTTGNYAEMYERNLGPSSGLGFERGLNRLWTQGGLLYAPPMD